MPHGSSALALRLALVYSAIFLWVGLYLPYWPVWLGHRGMSATEVGILLAVSPWTRVLASPLVGRWADRTGRGHRAVQVFSLLLVAAIASFAFVDGFWPLLILMVAIGLLFAPIVPLVDGITVGAEAEGRLSYGPVRLWGSGAFVVASWIGGELLERTGEGSVQWLLVGAASLTAVTSLLLPSSIATPRHTPAPADRSAGSRFSTRSREFFTFLVVSGLLHMGHAVLYGFGTLHWRDAGLDDGTVGLLWAEGVVAEIVLFAVAPRIGPWLTPRTLWLAAGVGGVLRWSMMASTSVLGWMVVAQLLHALTFGALHLGAMAYLRLRVPTNRRAHAATLYSAAATGLAMGVGLPAAGLLYERFGGEAYWAMAACAATGTIIAGLGLRESRKSD